jgi:hypothetical protein
VSCTVILAFSCARAPTRRNADSRQRSCMIRRLGAQCDLRDFDQEGRNANDFAFGIVECKRFWIKAVECKRFLIEGKSDAKYFCIRGVCADSYACADMPVRLFVRVPTVKSKRVCTGTGPAQLTPTPPALASVARRRSGASTELRMGASFQCDTCHLQNRLRLLSPKKLGARATSPIFGAGAGALLSS